MIKRQAAGQTGEVQLIATNIDFAFIMQAAGRDFNINRLERYLSICHSSQVKPVIILDGGGILIDNPGMREVGITDDSDGLEMTFDTIYTLSQNCRFADCSHISETGCAVIAYS